MLEKDVRMETTVEKGLARAKRGKPAEDVGQLSQWTLIRRRFMKNRLSVVGAIVLLAMYLAVLFADFLAPYQYDQIDGDHQYAGPTPIIWANGGFGINGVTQVLDKENYQYVYTIDPSIVYPIRLFATATEPYLMWGVIPLNTKLFGIDAPADSTARLFLWGADRQGRDVFSRVLKGGQISLSIGFIGVLISVTLASIIGTASGYFGGLFDTILQRIIELIQTFPFISIFIAIAAALPTSMPVVQRYLLITVIFALISWTGLSREIRGKVLGYRSADYTNAAIASGASSWWVLSRHMIPNALSHIIVAASFAVPGAIASETALSFLNLGMLPPAVSWGVLLQDAQQVQSVVLYPWLLIPLGAIILASLCLYLLGDGLRDAVDPYS
jgi:peptide/nickel transport system permease protein